MNDTGLEAIVQNFLSIMPLFKKKLVNHNHDSDCIHSKFNHSHFQIMAVLKKEGMLPISEIGKKLLISTPNMTKLLNRLIDEEMIERIPSKNDRRIINIILTKQGNDYINKQFKHVQDSLKERFSTLSDDQLVKLDTSLNDLKEVLMEISSEE